MARSILTQVLARLALVHLGERARTVARLALKAQPDRGQRVPLALQTVGLALEIAARSLVLVQRSLTGVRASLAMTRTS